MELHQLEYVLTVAKHQHFTRAAEELCLTQPSLSQQILKLEEELGIRLFERTTRTVKLTPAGKEFLIYAKRILSDAQKAHEAMQQYIGLEKGNLVIGGLPIIGNLGLTRLIASFQNTYPGIHIEIREAGTFDLIKWLYSAEIDVALLTPIPDLKGDIVIDFFPLIDDELVLIVNSAHPFAKKGNIDLSEAANEKFILQHRSQGIHRIIVDICRRVGFEPCIVCETSQIATLAGFVAEGLGVAFLTTRIALSCAHPSISIVKFTPTVSRTTALAMPRHMYHQPIVGAFKKFALTWAQQNI